MTAETLIAVAGPFIDANFGRIDLVKGTILDWREIGHDDVGPYKEALLASVCSIDCGQSCRAGNVCSGADDARKRDHFVNHLFGCGDLLVRFNCRSQLSNTERCGRMRNVRADSDHIQIKSAKREDIISEAFERLAWDTDHNASAGLITKLLEFAEQA